MRAVVVIPARYASTRFPGKPLAQVMGKPLIEHVYRRACGAKTVERVIVATDDHRILKVVEKFGGECILTAAEHRSGSDRLGELATGLDAEVIVNVQGDEPLMEPSVIDAVVNEHLGADPPDIATVAVPLGSVDDFSDRHVVKVVTDTKGYALYFSRSPVPHGWYPGSGVALRHIGIYGYRREALLNFVSLPVGRLEIMEDLEQLRALENGMSISVVTIDEFKGIGVDRPEDLTEVERLMRATGGGAGSAATIQDEGGE